MSGEVRSITNGIRVPQWLLVIVGLLGSLAAIGAMTYTYVHAEVSKVEERTQHLYEIQAKRNDAVYAKSSDVAALRVGLANVEDRVKSLENTVKEGMEAIRSDLRMSTRGSRINNKRRH